MVRRRTTKPRRAMRRAEKETTVTSDDSSGRLLWSWWLVFSECCVWVVPMLRWFAVGQAGRARRQTDVSNSALERSDVIEHGATPLKRHSVDGVWCLPVCPVCVCRVPLLSSLVGSSAASSPLQRWLQRAQRVEFRSVPVPPSRLVVRRCAWTGSDGRAHRAPVSETRRASSRSCLTRVSSSDEQRGRSVLTVGPGQKRARTDKGGKERKDDRGSSTGS